MDQGRGYRGRGRHSDGQRGGRSGGNSVWGYQQWRPSSTSSTSTSTSTTTTRLAETNHVRQNGRRERSGTSWRAIKVNNRPVGFDNQATSPSEPVPARNHENLRVSGIDASTAPFATEGKILPIKRLDEGGKLAIQLSALHLNQFPVRFDPNNMIYLYNVDVQSEVPSKNDMDKKISKSNLYMIRKILYSEHLTEFSVSKNIFIVVILKEGKYSVKVSEGEDAQINAYVISLSFVKTFKVRRLRDYICKQMNSFACKFFSRDERKAENVGNGLTALLGNEQGLMTTYQGSLRLDYSILASRKKMSVIDFLKDHIPKLEPNRLSEFRDHIEEALKGLKVPVIHHRTNQKYTICWITLVDYFEEKYVKDIVYKDIPCLDFVKGRKSKYIPMEFFVLVEGQRYLKEQFNKTAIVILSSMPLANADERKQIINEMVKSPDGTCGGGSEVHNFVMEVEKFMTTVNGCVIGHPELKLGNPDAVSQFMKIEDEPRKFQWNLVEKSVVEGKQVDRWSLLDFSKHNKFYQLDFERFKQNLLRRSRRIGINMAPPSEYRALPMKALTDIHSFIKQELEKMQLTLHVTPKKDPGYKYLKWICETQVGVVTQCCLSKTANEGNEQYFANLCLKINEKLGGSNVKLMNTLPPPLEGKGHVMFIGADSNHPASRNTTGPSIAADVGTVNWPAANQFEGTVADTTIVHPCSHYGSLGTSKARHYNFLLDEHEFSSESLQKLIYRKCVTSARCTKPVSLVPPVYFADLAAY